MMTRSALPALAALLALSACGQPQPEASPGKPEISACLRRTGSPIGGPITMTDQTGRHVTQDDFKGRQSFVYFGFTNCPDVCPFTLQALGAAIEQLPEGVEAPRTILISVDPGRDTPEEMAAYIQSNGFPHDMVGLVPTPAELDAARDEFKAYYKRVDQPDSAAGYTMDHTSIIYLMDRDWTLKTFFTPDETPADISACIAALADK